MSDEPKKYWTEDDELVSQYVLGQFSPETMRQMEEEIADCAPCKAKLKQEMDLAAGMRRHGRDLKKATLRTKLRRARDTQFNANHFVGMAAAVVLVLLAVGAYTVWLGDLSTPTSFGKREVVLHQDSLDAEYDALQELPDGTAEEGSAEDAALAEADVPDAEQTLSAPPGDPSSKPERTIAQEQTADQEPEGRASEGNTSTSAPAASRAVQRPAAPSSSNSASAGTGNSTAAKRSQNAPAMVNRAMADAAPAATEGPIPGNSKAIWLIGKVVMVSAQKSTVQNGMAKEQNLAAASRGRRPAEAGIVLQQRPIKELPQGLLQRKRSAEVSVQTMMERTDEGVSVTLYGDAVSGEELQYAVVETFTDDSLVVSLPNHRLSFRLPEGWGRARGN